MENLNQAYGETRRKRATDRNKVELKFKEDLLFLKNEEVDEWLEICNRIHEGELDYKMENAIMNLGRYVKERDALLEEVEDLKVELGLIEDPGDTF